MLLQDHTVGVWDMKSPTDITLRTILHSFKTRSRLSVWAVDFSETNIIAGENVQDIHVRVELCAIIACNKRHYCLHTAHMVIYFVLEYHVLSRNVLQLVHYPRCGTALLEGWSGPSVDTVMQ